VILIEIFERLEDLSAFDWEVYINNNYLTSTINNKHLLRKWNMGHSKNS
jgi:hypothetical protein